MRIYESNKGWWGLGLRPNKEGKMVTMAFYLKDFGICLEFPPNKTDEEVMTEVNKSKVSLPTMRGMFTVESAVNPFGGHILIARYTKDTSETYIFSEGTELVEMRAEIEKQRA